MSRAFEIEATADRVAAWSDFRLPFEPKGDAREFRDQLRVAVRGLGRRPILQAEYVSPDSSPCDVENVLLYNVGAGSFTALGTDALMVERRHAAAPITPSATPHSHFVEYRSRATSSAWTAWRPRRTLISWSGVPAAGALSAATVWASMKAGRAAVGGHWDGRTPLGVTVRVSSDRPIVLVANVKSLLDGIVAAAHMHEGLDVAEVAALVAAKLRLPVEQSLAWLTDDVGAALGPRRLLVRRAGGVQWNPADDGLVAISIERSRATTGGTSITSELYELEPASTS